MTKRLTIVAYAINGSGLGHLTRVVAILRWIKRLSKLAGIQADIYILTSSEGCALALQEGFAAFKIPSKTAIRAAQIPKEDYLRLARQWVWHSIGLLRPDILLVDTFPGGSFGELLQALDGPGTRVFIHRAMKEEFLQQDIIQSLLPLYDRILVPEEAGTVSHKISDILIGRTSFIGPILSRDRDELRLCHEARIILGIPENKLGVWISTGGGGDVKAEKVLNNLIEVLKLEPDLHLVIGAGPLYRGNPIRSLNITWITEFNAIENFTGLDFAISAAGYNTFHELLYAGVPTAFFAQHKIADDQARRIKAAVQSSSALSISVNEDGILNISELKNALSIFRHSDKRKILAENASNFVPKNCAREAAIEVLSTQFSRVVLEEACEVGTANFFAKLKNHEVSIETTYEILQKLNLIENFDGNDQLDLLVEIFTASDFSGEISAQLFLNFARRLPKPTTINEAETLVSSTISVLKSLNRFQDTQGAVAFFKLFTPDRDILLQVASNALCEFLNALADKGESLWRGMAILSRHQTETGLEHSLVNIIQSATEIVKDFKEVERSTRSKTKALSS